MSTLPLARVPLLFFSTTVTAFYKSTWFSFKILWLKYLSVLWLFWFWQLSQQTSSHSCNAPLSLHPASITPTSSPLLTNPRPLCPCRPCVAFISFILTLCPRISQNSSAPCFALVSPALALVLPLLSASPIPLPLFNQPHQTDPFHKGHEWFLCKICLTNYILNIHLSVPTAGSREQGLFFCALSFRTLPLSATSQWHWQHHCAAIRRETCQQRMGFKLFLTKKTALKQLKQLAESLFTEPWGVSGNPRWNRDCL